MLEKMIFYRQKDENGPLSYSTEKKIWNDFKDLNGSSDSKDSDCNVGYPSSILGSGRPFGKGNGNPLQYSCLENSMDREAWQAI